MLKFDNENSRCIEVPDAEDGIYCKNCRFFANEFLVCTRGMKKYCHVLADCKPDGFCSYGDPKEAK